MVVMNGQLYQLVIVPVLAPLPVAWLAVGFKVDDTFAHDLHRLTRLQVSFLTRREGDGWRVQASTLSEPDRAILLGDMAGLRFANTDSDGNASYSDDTITRILDLSVRRNETVTAVLQEPLSVALGRSAAAATAGIDLAHRRPRLDPRKHRPRTPGQAPVRELADAARRIAARDYGTVPLASRNDEIGDLRSVHAMQDGIISANRDHRPRLSRHADRTAEPRAVRRPPR
jgi:hypothetical protein